MLNPLRLIHIVAICLSISLLVNFVYFVFLDHPPAGRYYLSTGAALLFHQQDNPPDVSSQGRLLGPLQEVVDPVFPNVIPIIHQSWKTHHLPRRFNMWASSWRKCFPNWQYKLWSDKENDDFIVRYYPWFARHYFNFPEKIHRVDVVRYFYMYHYGGIYADLDAECRKPFESLLTGNFSIVMGAMQGQGGFVYIKEGYTENSFMYSQPKQAFWLELIHKIMQAWYEPGVEEVTGPIMLIQAINEYRQRFPNKIKIYPHTYFNPFHWSDTSKPECKVYNAMTDDEWRRCRAYFNDSYVVQYHSQSWRLGKAV